MTKQELLGKFFSIPPESWVEVKENEYRYFDYDTDLVFILKFVSEDESGMAFNARVFDEFDNALVMFSSRAYDPSKNKVAPTSYSEELLNLYIKIKEIEQAA